MEGWGSKLADQLGRLRYGVPTSEKEAFARQEMAPMIGDESEDLANSDRAAAGYMFAEQWPRVQEAVQPWVDRARIGWGGDTPEEQSYATYGANLAKLRRR